MSNDDCFTFINDLTSFFGSRGQEVHDALIASRVHVVRYTTIERQQKRIRRPSQVTGHVVRPRSGKGEMHHLTHNPAPINYAIALEMHELWSAYHRKITGMDQCPLINIDLHGARIKVLRATMPTYVGVSGICVRETLATIELVTEANKHVFVPKTAADFGLLLPDSTVYLLGKLLRRRGSKKLKRFNTELDGQTG